MKEFHNRQPQIQLNNLIKLSNGTNAAYPKTFNVKSHKFDLCFGAMKVSHSAGFIKFTFAESRDVSSFTMVFNFNVVSSRRIRFFFVGDVEWGLR